jgi:hypothetical protein
MKDEEGSRVMANPPVSEQEVVEALRSLSPDRWPEVLAFIASLRGREDGAEPPAAPVLTARDLLQSSLVGIWADRADLGDSREFARRLREQAEHRGRGDAAGH